jgi:hypothetical protein
MARWPGYGVKAERLLRLTARSGKTLRAGWLFLDAFAAQNGTPFGPPPLYLFGLSLSKPFDPSERTRS